jgi:hypothetical protein
MTADTKTKSFSGFPKFARQLVAATVWIFAFSKLFVYDFDLALINRYAPPLQRLLPYRFFIIIAFIAFAWLLLGNRKFWLFVAYVLFYPLIIVFWRISKLTVKNWATILVFAPAIESLIKTFKWRFIGGSLTMLSALAIVIVYQRYVLAFAMAVLFLYLIIHYILRFRIAFRSSTFFADIAKPLGSMWEQTLSTFRKKEAEDAAQLGLGSEDFRKSTLRTCKPYLCLI